MPSHRKASVTSRSLCEQLQAELRKLIPDLAAAVSKNTCGLYQPGKNRFAYVYHRSDARLIRVYFRGDPIVHPSAPGADLAINVRPKIGEGWDKDFPFFLSIEDSSHIQAAASLLFQCAWPLSSRKRRGTAAGEVADADFRISEEIPEDAKLSEGATKRIHVNVYERNPTARILCIKHYGAKCSVCGFDFQKVYGDRGKGFIHVHHIRALAEIKASYGVNPVADLRPVCPNCHAMIHRTNPPATCAEIRKIFTRDTQQGNQGKKRNKWGIPAWLEDEVRSRDRACVYCGVEMTKSASPWGTRRNVATWEHIINDASIVTRENIALCCTACNSSKGAKELSEWLTSQYCKRHGITEDSVADVIKAALEKSGKGKT